MLLGGNVTKTIAGGIAKTSTFAKYPAIFMFGMLCAEVGAMLWILFATYLELPVSTTHSIIGGVVGFALVFGGGNAVTWYSRTNKFPYIGGMVPVFVSWFLSPLLAALITLVLFLIIRTLVLRRANSTKVAFWVLPVLVFVTIWVNLFFILTKGAKNLVSIPEAKGAWIAAVAGAGAAGVACVALFPIMTKYVKNFDAAQQNGAAKDVEGQVRARHRRCYFFASPPLTLLPPRGPLLPPLGVLQAAGCLSTLHSFLLSSSLSSPLNRGPQTRARRRAPAPLTTSRRTASSSASPTPSSPSR